MKTSLLFLSFLLISVIPNNSYSQRTKKPIVEKPKNINPTPKPITVIPDKINNLGNPRISSPSRKIKVDQDNSNNSRRKDKIYTKRPPRRNHPKRKKPIIKNEPVLIVRPVVEGYCIVDDFDNYGEIEISEYSFPEFPLRFLSANIFYEFTDRGKDYYKILIDVETVYNNYFNTFGVLIKHFNGREQVIVFNENNEFLRLGESFKFHKQIKIKETGYMNLRLGYYDDELEVFYPEDLYPERTDKMIFLGNPDRVYLYSYN